MNTITVTVTRPTLALLAPVTAETSFDTADGYVALELAAEPLPGVEGYALAVTAEAWGADSDDDDEGEPVRALPALAALLGCEPAEDTVAALLDGLLADVMHARWEHRADA